MTGNTYQYIATSGETFEMVPVEIVKSEEYWSKLYLADGTVLKVKLVVAQAGRSIDKPVPGGAGEPVYQIKSQAVVVAEVPDELKFGKEDSGKK